MSPLLSTTFGLVSDAFIHRSARIYAQSKALVHTFLLTPHVRRRVRSFPRYSHFFIKIHIIHLPAVYLPTKLSLSRGPALLVTPNTIFNLARRGRTLWWVDRNSLIEKDLLYLSIFLIFVSIFSYFLGPIGFSQLKKYMIM